MTTDTMKRHDEPHGAAPIDSVNGDTLPANHVRPKHAAPTIMRDQPQQGFSRRMALVSLCTALFVAGAVGVAIMRSDGYGGRRTAVVPGEQRPAGATTSAVAPVSDQEMRSRVMARREALPIIVYIVGSEDARQQLLEAIAERDYITLSAGEDSRRTVVEVARTPADEARVWTWATAAGVPTEPPSPAVQVIDLRNSSPE